MKRGHQPIWAHDDWTFRKLEIVLLNAFEIVSRRICLSNRPRSEIHDLIPVSCNVRVELCDSKMCPVAANHGKDVTKGIGSKHSE